VRRWLVQQLPYQNIALKRGRFNKLLKKDGSKQAISKEPIRTYLHLPALIFT
jgi:hypothetical protein